MAPSAVTPSQTAQQTAGLNAAAVAKKIAQTVKYASRCSENYQYMYD